MEEYGKFLHKPDKYFTNYKDIRNEIESETQRICPGKTISKKPIILKIQSPKLQGS